MLAEEIQKEFPETAENIHTSEQLFLPPPTALLNLVYISAVSFTAITIFAAIVALPAAVIALIVTGAALLLALVGAKVFYDYTCIIKAEYAANPAKAALRYGFATYAALKASWSWPVRAVAC